MVTPQDKAAPQPERRQAKYWHNQIQAAEDREKKWRETGQKVVARYLDEREGYSGGEGCERRVNILWSNTEVLQGNLYSELGTADVRRAFPQPGNANKVARTAALVLERNIISCANRYNVDAEFEDAITDYLTAARGQVWVEYDAVIDRMPTKVTKEDDETGEAEEEEVTEKIRYQKAEICHVPWTDWTHGPAKKWRDVPWVARKLLFTPDDCARTWPQFNNSMDKTTIPCNHVLTEGKDRNDDQGATDFKRATVWEIWDKRSQSRIYVANDFQWELEREDDPYRVESFFPCPEPLYGVKGTDRLLPRPEYMMYKDQAEELDRCNTRIWKLLESLKFRGVRFAGLDGEDTLSDIANLEDGEFLPLKNFQALAQGGGLKEAFQVMDLAPIAVAIQAAAERAVQLIQSIYEITGISDVVRGSSDPNETATAQNIKARFGSQRLQKRQKKVHRFVRDAIRIKGEIIAEHFEREQLSQASGVPLPTEAERAQARATLQQFAQQQKMQQMMAQQAQMAQQQPQGGPPMPQMQPQPQGAMA